MHAVTPTYHPDDTCLIDYAKGTLPAAVALTVAVHLEYCESCRNAVQALQEVAADSITQQPTLKKNPDENSDKNSDADNVLEFITPSTTSAEINSTSTQQKRPILFTPTNQEKAVSLPKILDEYVPKESRWSIKGKTLGLIKILDYPSASCSFLHLQDKATLPEHTHEGEEYIVILEGSLKDENNQCTTGDFIKADHNTTHTPTAVGDCLCLAAVTAPVKFTGLKGRIYNALGLGKL